MIFFEISSGLGTFKKIIFVDFSDAIEFLNDTFG
jgi:hypothetical protein